MVRNNIIFVIKVKRIRQGIKVDQESDEGDHKNCDEKTMSCQRRIQHPNCFSGGLLNTFNLKKFFFSSAGFSHPTLSPGPFTAQGFDCLTCFLVIGS